ncbi:PH domain-containing protein [Phycicoccus endophyticus]|uniref:PH domain-containing protein n=1 Tax=Phycicoccus endophyticus TaxID=1690220 RepID=A0A7G9R400_9MICO|nr:PH domain-containing protein [Phycicoccus endophyticus]NHI18164.1 PH domain-containing protein [Phycicoccus endophyticus]QNN50325.1 PH domain-containing protein [Phycicoccus endophyticus]GGL25960.1 membrane protein [Phycicoccus endophyticus]
MTQPDTEGGWQRLHPLSPLLRGGVVLLAVLGYLVSQLVDEVLGSFDAGGYVPGGDAGPQEEWAWRAYPLLALAVLVLVIAAVAGASWVSWRFSRFRVADGQVELRTGVLFRQHRQVPLERVQAVETTRPLLARAVGLSQVVVQSAGGSDSHLTLAFLGAERAERVRAHLLELAGRSDEGAPAQRLPGAAEEVEGAEPLVAVPNGRLFVATILHGSTLVLGVVLVVGGFALGVGRVGLEVLAAAPALIPVVLGLGVSRVKELLVHGNFSLARSRTSLRVRHGLTDLRVASVPLHRVQAVEVLQPLWWRPWGWWRVRVNVAGVQGEGGDDEETTLLPVGTLAEALTVLGALGAHPEDPVLHEALTGTGGESGWTGPPRVARWLDPWSWRRAGYALAAHAVYLRAGRFTRHALVVPHARVQSLALDQGPLQGRLALASVRVVSTPGPVGPQVQHLAVADAERLLARVAERARVARRRVPDPAPALTRRPEPPLAPGGAPLVD